MKQIQVTKTQAAWLAMAARYAQSGGDIDQALKWSEIVDHIRDDAELTNTQTFAVGEAVDIALGGQGEDPWGFTAEQLTMLHAQLSRGTQWPFANWTTDMLRTFRAFCTHVQTWVDEAANRERWDALTPEEQAKIKAEEESEKRKALVKKGAK